MNRLITRSKKKTTAKKFSVRKNISKKGILFVNEPRVNSLVNRSRCATSSEKARPLPRLAWGAWLRLSELLAWVAIAEMGADKASRLVTKPMSKSSVEAEGNRKKL
tara:strand:- start:3818 stop:4135 length:318 start_codon:yes stop_codon:yes gene_type:complete